MSDLPDPELVQLARRVAAHRRAAVGLTVHEIGDLAAALVTLWELAEAADEIAAVVEDHLEMRMPAQAVAAARVYRAEFAALAVRKES